jgi:hypothetical protein
MIPNVLMAARIADVQLRALTQMRCQKPYCRPSCGLHDDKGSEILLTHLLVHVRSRSGKLRAAQHHSKVVKRKRGRREWREVFSRVFYSENSQCLL